MRLRIRLGRRGPSGLARRIVYAAAMLAAAGIVLGAIFGLSFLASIRSAQRATQVAVPDLRGIELAEASERAAELGLIVQIADQRHDPAVSSGRILDQVPPAGSEVRRGRKVKVIISLGGEVLVVPDVSGDPDRTVEIELRRGGLLPGETAYVRAAGVAEGTVLAQVPDAGTPAVPSTRVHRLVSGGTPVAVWVMPDLTGLPRGSVEAWLEVSGFRRGAVRRVSMDGRAPETVVGQLPLAGYPVRARDVVELTVAR